MTIVIKTMREVKALYFPLEPRQYMYAHIRRHDFVAEFGNMSTLSRVKDILKEFTHRKFNFYSWATARDLCISLNSDLLVLKSKFELPIFYEYLNKKRLYLSSIIFLGLYRTRVCLLTQYIIVYSYKPRLFFHVAQPFTFVT